MTDAEQHNTRRLIIESARRIFSQRGFDGTSMADIAKEVGIQKPSLYHFFKSKEEIYFTVLNTIMAEVTEMFQADPRKDTRSVFEKVVAESIQRGIDHGAGIVDTTRIYRSSPDLLEEASQNFIHMREAIVSFLSRCGVADPSFTAQLLIDSNQMYLIRVSCGDARFSVKEYTRRLADLLLSTNR